MPRTYNFEHFRTSNLLIDAAKTIARAGVPPGRPAPDFELTQVGGSPWRLTANLDRPVLLHFGSFS